MCGWGCAGDWKSPLLGGWGVGRARARGPLRAGWVLALENWKLEICRSAALRDLVEAAGGLGLEEGEEFGAGEVEVVEGDGVSEGEAESGAGDERRGGEGEEGDVGGFGELAEAVPRGVRDAAELSGGQRGEIEEDEGEVAVAQQEIGGAEGLGGIAATKPEEAGAFLGGEGGGVEAVAGVDQCQRGVGLVILGEQGGDDEGEAAGGVAGRDLGDGAGGEVRSSKFEVPRGVWCFATGVRRVGGALV